MIKYICKIISLMILSALLTVTAPSCGPSKVPVVGDNRSSRTEKSTNDPETDPSESSSDIAADQADSDPLVSEPVEEHIHSAAGGRWEADLTNHWRECSCTESFDISAHTLQYSVCTVCNAQISTYDGDRTGLSIYNDKGDILLDKLYDRYSNELYSLKYTYTYTDLGATLTEKVTKNGVIFYERSYDAYGNVTSEIKYSPAGVPVTE